MKDEVIIGGVAAVLGAVVGAAVYSYAKGENGTVSNTNKSTNEGTIRLQKIEKLIEELKVLEKKYDRVTEKEKLDEFDVKMNEIDKKIEKQIKKLNKNLKKYNLQFLYLLNLSFGLYCKQ